MDLLKKNEWESIQWRVDTPEGTAYITISEETPGKIAFIQVSIGKAGTSLAGLVYALAASVSDNLQFMSIRQVQERLSGIASDKPKRSLAKNSTKSIPEAIVWVLDQYMSDTQPIPNISGRRLRR